MKKFHLTTAVAAVVIGFASQAKAVTVDDGYHIIQTTYYNWTIKGTRAWSKIYNAVGTTNPNNINVLNVGGIFFNPLQQRVPSIPVILPYGDYPVTPFCPGPNGNPSGNPINSGMCGQEHAHYGSTYTRVNFTPPDVYKLSNFTNFGQYHDGWLVQGPSPAANKVSVDNPGSVAEYITVERVNTPTPALTPALANPAVTVYFGAINPVLTTMFTSSSSPPSDDFTLRTETREGLVQYSEFSIGLNSRGQPVWSVNFTDLSGLESSDFLSANYWITTYPIVLSNLNDLDVQAAFSAAGPVASGSLPPVFQPVPEIDAASGVGAMTLLVGVLCLVRERRRRQVV